MSKTVLIAGASGGFGSEFAKIFAKKGYNLILVVRNKKVLNSPQVLFDVVTKAGLSVDILDPTTVARIGCEGLVNNKRVFIIGIKNKFIIESLRILPRSIVSRLVLFMQRPT